MSTSTPRFLADEGCDFAVVRALREAGFDVVAVCEITNRSEDSDLIQRSQRENRILLTEDKDFGWLVFRKVPKYLPYSSRKSPAACCSGGSTPRA